MFNRERNWYVNEGPEAPKGPKRLDMEWSVVSGSGWRARWVPSVDENVVRFGEVNSMSGGNYLGFKNEQIDENLLIAVDLEADTLLLRFDQQPQDTRRHVIQDYFLYLCREGNIVELQNEKKGISFYMRFNNIAVANPGTRIPIEFQYSSYTEIDEKDSDIADRLLADIGFGEEALKGDRLIAVSAAGWEVTIPADQRMEFRNSGFINTGINLHDASGKDTHVGFEFNGGNLSMVIEEPANAKSSVPVSADGLLVKLTHSNINLNPIFMRFSPYGGAVKVDYDPK